jgi:hypothetical protein
MARLINDEFRRTLMNRLDEILDKQKADAKERDPIDPLLKEIVELEKKEKLYERFKKMKDKESAAIDTSRRITSGPFTDGPLTGPEKPYRIGDGAKPLPEVPYTSYKPKAAPGFASILPDEAYVGDCMVSANMHELITTAESLGINVESLLERVITAAAMAAHKATEQMTETLVAEAAIADKDAPRVESEESGTW